MRADKQREAGDGHDGTWVAHPGLVAIAKDVFDAVMTSANQIARKRQDVHVTAADLLDVPEGTITEAGLRQNINVGIGYIEAWLRGIGCVPLLQSDGRCRHRRDQPRAGLAVGAPRPDTCRTAGRSRRSSCARSCARRTTR